MHFTFQKLAPVLRRHILLASILALTLSPSGFAQSRRSTSRKRPATVKRRPTGTARIEVTAVATLHDGALRPVAKQEFVLLAVDPDFLKKQVAREIPLPDPPPRDPSTALSAAQQAAADEGQVADEFHVSTGLVTLAQKAPQPGTTYLDEDKYRRLEDYAHVAELRDFYDALVKKRVKRGNMAALNDAQKLELVKTLDAEFNRLPPPDKMAIPIRVARLVMEREDRAFQQNRRHMEATAAAKEKRRERFQELCRELEKSGKAYRATSDTQGVSRFVRLPAGSYWVYADNFVFERIASSWNVPVVVKPRELRRVEISMGDR